MPIKPKNAPTLGGSHSTSKDLSYRPVYANAARGVCEGVSCSTVCSRQSLNTGGRWAPPGAAGARVGSGLCVQSGSWITTFLRDLVPLRRGQKWSPCTRKALKPVIERREVTPRGPLRKQRPVGVHGGQRPPTSCRAWHTTGLGPVSWRPPASTPSGLNPSEVLRKQTAAGEDWPSP